MFMSNLNYIYPLKLNHVAKETVWGGSYLYEKYGKLPSGIIGETWELAVREREKNTIVNGPCADMTLNEYLEKYSSISVTDFPLLIKFIDACDDLSVQVHPNDENASDFGLANGKTEIWYVIKASPDSSIVYGTLPGTTKEMLRESLLNRSVKDLLNYVQVSPGEAYFIPGGMMHMIGRGIVVAEIQQNSDTTFRVYDHDRVDKNGVPRELHVENAIAAFTSFSDEDIQRLTFSHTVKNDMGGKVLTANRFFTVISRSINGLETFSEIPNEFLSLLCTDGYGSIIWEGGKETISPGDSFFIPAELSHFKLEGKAEVLFSFKTQDNN
jgi:mannose-6-phosphate isomerase